MARFLRGVLLAGATCAALVTAHRASADLLVTFQAPHVVRPPAATLTVDLTQSVDAQLVAASVTSIDELLRFSLGVTDGALRFGLGHPTSLRFDAKEREGNCIEYANLFAAIFNRGARQKHIAAHAYVVHSDARVLGQKLPARGMSDHDWVLVVPSAPAASPRDRTLFVDPTFHDLGLDWDVSTSVIGAVRAP